jgi:hypothetical protein
MFLRSVVVLVVLGIFLQGGRVWADEVSSQEPKYGISAGAFLSSMVACCSGPETPLSRTTYSDTFDSGSGVRIEVYRNYSRVWRGQVGLVHTRWPGKYFVGGEFPAGAQFGDFSLSGIYVGGRVASSRVSGIRPYANGNLGIVRMSSLSVESGGTTIPYWSDNWTSYAEVGAGVAWQYDHGRALTVDLRLQLFGAPESANYPIAEATGGGSLLLGVGYEWGVR